MILINLDFNVKYEWTFEVSRQPILWQLVRDFTVWFISLIIVYIMLLTIGYYLPLVSLLIATLCLLVPLIHFGLQAYRIINNKKSHPIEAGVIQLLTGSLLYIMSCSDLLLDKSFVSAQTPTSFDWLIYLFDNTMDVLLFDMTEIFEMHLSSIKPHSLLAKTMVFTLRTFIGIGLIDLIWTRIKHYYTKQVRYGTIEDLYGMIQPYSDDDYVYISGEVVNGTSNFKTKVGDLKHEFDEIQGEGG